MKKYTLKRTMPFALAATILFTGCGKKSECEIPTRHVHKYIKQVTDDITIEKYIDDEHLNLFGYKWNEDYIEINKVDEELYKLLKKKGLFDGATNWYYLYNLMANNQDYLKFYYENDTGENYTSGWHSNPYYSDNTGKLRLYHHRYYGYRIVYENGKFKVERSPEVDDIRDIINDYPYFSEDCVTEVYETFKFKKYELKYLSPEDFDTFMGPDLDNHNLKTEESRGR